MPRPKVILLVAIWLCVSFGIGLLCPDVFSEPEIVIVEVPVYVEAEMTVTKTVEVIKEVEVIREVSVGLRPFSSLHELAVWQANNYIKDAQPDKCIDTALELCRKARQDGYEMSTEVWKDGQPKAHMICSTVISDKVYFLEPTLNHVWLAGRKME